MSSSINPLNPTNPNAYQAPPANPAKKRVNNTGVENVQDDPSDQENDDPTQWIDQASNTQKPADTSTQSSNPVSRQRRFNNGLNKA